jgi:hypothetical protein
MNYTKEQLAFLFERKIMPRRELTEAFSRQFGTCLTIDAIKATCLRKRWHTGRTGCFPKGNVPTNKGTKGLTSRNRTSFEPGNRPKNWKPVGSERICSKQGYILIKVAEPRTWRHKHTVLWETAYGPLRKNEAVTFKDGNILNVCLDNLEKISRRELLWLNRNGYTETPPELKSTLRMLAKVNVKSSELGSKNKLFPE